MFVPIRDDNPLTKIPFQYVTVGLIAINVVVFFLTASIDDRVSASLALVPNELIKEGIFGPAVTTDRFDDYPLPERGTLITYMFLHANVLHLAGNMLFLWVFGDNIEDALGHFRFLIFYLLCGVAAGLAHVWMSSGEGASSVPLVGASGAVAGCVGAYLLLHPKVRIWILVFRIIPLQITAMWALGAWAAMQVFMALTPQQAPVAWWAHVGGLIAGALLVIVMRRPGVPLFDRVASEA